MNLMFRNLVTQQPVTPAAPPVKEPKPVKWSTGIDFDQIFADETDREENGTL
jgi:hypothetical protein